MRTATLLLLLFAIAGCSSSDSPSDVDTLRNDNFNGGALAFQAGFLTGEAAAVVFPPRGVDFTVRNVAFYFGGGSGTRTLTLTIYADNGGLTPGVILHSHDYDITPSDTDIQRINLVADQIVVPANSGLRIALAFQHDGAPGLALDSDGITAQRNLIFTAAAWMYGETAGLPGDVILRADIETE
jgi:hypothetical protein